MVKMNVVPQEPTVGNGKLKVCRDCAAYNPRKDVQDQIIGECHNNPPGVMMMGDGRMANVWPPVRHNDWCKKWGSKIEVVQAVPGL